MCEGCGIQLAPTMLACPNCKRLIHSAQLESLAAQAQSAAAVGDKTAALELWRVALELLPRDSKQFALIADQVSQLGQSLSHAPNSTNDPYRTTTPQSHASGTPNGVSKAGFATGLGALGLFAWKFKILLLGLTKSTTLFSMLASLGVYWTVWGWKFALGLILSIYVHEMGHIIQLRRYGFRTGPPTFIPGLGAFIRMQQQVVNPREDADIGLAGPIYGLGAALVSLGLWQATALPIFAAIAGVGAWVNLFNLLPFGSLDGGRGFHAMTRAQKFAATACVAVAWWIVGDGMLVLLLIGCVAQLLAHKANHAGYSKAAWIYCLLVVCLTAISMVRFPEGIPNEAEMDATKNAFLSSPTSVPFFRQSSSRNTDSNMTLKPPPSAVLAMDFAMLQAVPKCIPTLVKP